MKKRKRCPPPDLPARCEICRVRENLQSRGLPGRPPVVLCGECRKDADRLSEKYGWEA